MAKFFLGILTGFYPHFINICKQVIHNCKQPQANPTHAIGGYPHLARNGLILRGLGCGKKDLEMWKKACNFRERRVGYEPSLTENKFGSSSIFSYLCIVKEIVYIYESNK